MLIGLDGMTVDEALLEIVRVSVDRLCQYDRVCQCDRVCHLWDDS